MYKFGNSEKTLVRREEDGATFPVTHRFMRQALDWVNSAPENEIAEFMTDVEILSDQKREKIEAIRREALKLITARVPAIDSFSMVKFMAELWPMLDASKASDNLLAVKDIYQYAADQTQLIKDGNTAYVTAYTPEEDADWPS